MRCPHCADDVEEGIAVCPRCNTPLTRYSGQVTGEVRDSTLRKLAEASRQPQSVPYMAGFCVLFALCWPVWNLISRINARPQLNAESTNYVGAAFGQVGVFFAAMVLVPIALAMIGVAWGVWFQRSWAWNAAEGLVGVMILMGLTGFGMPNFFVRGLALVAAVAVGAMWMRGDSKRWYGF